MERLLDALEQVLLRVRCGHTLGQAVAGMPALDAPTPLCKMWTGLRDRIHEGSLPAEASLVSLIEHLRLHGKIKGLLRQKTLGARMQAQVVSGLALLFWLAGIFFFPNELRPPLAVSMTSLGLIALGSWWIRSTLRRAESSLWFADWIVFLSRLAGSLSWGMTLGPALASANEDLSHGSWPLPLQNAATALLESVRFYEALPENVLRALSAPQTDVELGRALEQLRWIHELHTKGQPLAETLHSFAKHSLEGLERKLSMNAEALSLKLLLPLFLCYLPAFLIGLFAPVLASLAIF